MSKAPDMIKHRGFPSGMPGTGVQFTIRRANDKGVTPIKTLPRKARPGTKEHRIDAAFLHALWHQFGAEPFVRGNLDAARLSLLFGREVVAVGDGKAAIIRARRGSDRAVIHSKGTRNESNPTAARLLAACPCGGDG